MLKETQKSLRLYLGLVSVISLIYGGVALAKSSGSLSMLAVGVVGIVFGLVFGYIVIGYSEILAKRAMFIKGALLANFAYSILVFLFSLTSGLRSDSVFQLVVAALIYFYLVRSVDRLSAECAKEDA